MNRKAIQLAISTLILMVLGLILLGAILVAVTGGFDRFRTTTDPFLDTTEASAVQQACSIACQDENKFAFFCTTHELGDEEIGCDDPRLEVNCGLVKGDFSCEA